MNFYSVSFYNFHLHSYCLFSETSFSSFSLILCTWLPLSLWGYVRDDLKSLSKKSNVMASTGTVSIHFLFPAYWPYCLFFCMPCKFLLITWQFECYDVATLKIMFTSLHSVLLLLVTVALVCLYSNFSKLILWSLYFVFYMATEVSVRLT